MSYQPVDRLPVLAVEPYERLAVTRWRNEGLPIDKAPEEFLGMTRLVHVGGAGLSPIPAFKETVVFEDDEYLEQYTTMGATVRRRKEAPRTFYGHIDNPIKTRTDWDRYKERLNPESPERLSGVLDPDNVRRLNKSCDPVGILFFPFFFRFGVYTMGMERFLTSFHDDPDLMRDVFAVGGGLILTILPRILDVIDVDFALFAEDLAWKKAPLISPETYYEFWYPWQDPIIQMLQDAGVPVICQWSAGRFDEILPGMLAHGFTCTWPLERKAGVDAAEMRSRFGKELLLGGNIAMDAVVEGPSAIDREIDRLERLIREGGFIPAMDDMVPIECPFDHYRYLIDRLQNIRL